MFHLLGVLDAPKLAFIGVLFAFLGTCFAIAKFSKFLPKDMGREFSHNGSKSVGKPRGAGIILYLFFNCSIIMLK